jgi:farnesyl diphosphate synthase
MLMLERNRNIVNKWISDYFSTIKSSNDLQRAIKYGISNGGKRLRPHFIIELSKILDIPQSSYRNLSLGIEFIHCYSLIHDDLPCMDNDDYRRGKLSVHKKFSESTAILAGNSIFSMALELILDKKTHKDEKIRSDLSRMILNYSGPSGLMEGQFYDLYYEKKPAGKLKILNTYGLKTSKLFELSMALPFILKKRRKKEIEAAKLYGRNFGLIYQIADDFSDLDKNFKETGKLTRKDKGKGKKTLVSKIGRKAALGLCDKLAEEATSRGSIFNNNKYSFKEMILNITKRVNS